MHARLSACQQHQEQQPQQQGSSKERGSRPHKLLTSTSAHSRPSSPIARLSLTAGSSISVTVPGGYIDGTSNWPSSAPSTTKRRSFCEPIQEDSSASVSPFTPISRRSAPLYSQSHSDLAVAHQLDLYKRHHKPRAPLQRTNSAPLLISTNTTQPIYINHTKATGCVSSYVSLSPRLFLTLTFL